MMMAAEPVNLCEEAAETLSRVLQSLMAYLDKKLVHIEPPLTRDEAVGRGEPLYTFEEIIGYRCHPSLEKNVMTSSHVLNCSEPYFIAVAIDEAEDPCMADVGILASLDPVAIDQACIDLVYAATDDPGQAHFIERVETMHGVHTIEAAAELGIGSRDYELVTL